MNSPITVRLPYIQEDIWIEPGILQSIRLQTIASNYDQMIIFADQLLETVQPDLVSSMRNQFGDQPITLLSVDDNLKSVGRYNELVTLLIERGATRRSCLVAVGGGHLGDLVGYLAATYMRGINFIQIPTTMMSMADAVIGKVAIDYEDHKNLLGAFASPRYVLCDPELLVSLSTTQKAEGLIEVWKHTLLEVNVPKRAEVDALLKNGLEGDYASLIRFSLDVKRKFVESDHSDTKGAHAALSLGHTLSNFLEKNAGISHGAGVLAGIIHAATLARDLDKISKKYFNIILATSREFTQFLPQAVQAQTWIDPEVASKQLQFDKINPKGSTRLIIMTNTGYEMVNLSHAQLTSSLTEFKHLRLL